MCGCELNVRDGVSCGQCDMDVCSSCYLSSSPFQWNRVDACPFTASPGRPAHTATSDRPASLLRAQGRLCSDQPLAWGNAGELRVPALRYQRSVGAKTVFAGSATASDATFGWGKFLCYVPAATFKPIRPLALTLSKHTVFAHSPSSSRPLPPVPPRSSSARRL